MCNVYTSAAIIIIINGNDEPKRWKWMEIYTKFEFVFLVFQTWFSLNYFEKQADFSSSTISIYGFVSSIHNISYRIHDDNYKVII